MNQDIFVYQTCLPSGMREVVVPCADGFTVYVDERLTDEQKIKAFNHAMRHICDGDWEKADVNEIEEKAHFNG